MKFDQLIEYNKKNTFLPKSCRNEAWNSSLEPFFFKKALCEVKVSGLQLSPHSTWNTIKANCVKLWTNDPEICSVLTF